MPTYVYKCNSCGKEVELVQKISERVFPKCDDESCSGLNSEMESVIGKTSFSLKGSGWAKDGYK